MSINTKIILIHGSYFANNFGDTLLIKLIADYIKENSDYVLRVATKGNRIEQKYLGIQLIKKYEYNSVRKIIYTGGGYFGEPRGSYYQKLKWSKRNYARHLKWKRNFKYVPTAIIGIGVGPISIYPFRKIVKYLFKKSNLLVVRDQESFDYCSLMGINKAHLCIDYAFSLYDNEPINKKKNILIHSNDIINRYFEIAIKELKKIYIDHKFILVSDTEKSSNKINKIKNSYSEYIDDYIPYKNVDKLLNIIKISDIILTSKLHVGITGISFKSRVISIPYHQKTMRLYKQLGISKYCTPQFSFDKNKLIKSIHEIDDFRPSYDLVEPGIKKINYLLDKFINDI